MNRNLFLLASILFFVTSCTQSSSTLTVKNDSDLERKDEAVNLSRTALEDVFGEFSDDMLPFLMLNDEPFPCQADDMDQDGDWDELFFLVDLLPGETKTFTLGFVSPDQFPEFTKRTNIRFGDKKPPHEELDAVERLKSNVTEISSKHFQMEGPAWENDVVGFRNYFDARNGIDIYGKRVSGMVLDSVGLNTSYHELADWGMDILKVGNSLGAGAIAMLYKDSVYRLGLTEEAFYNKVTEGPLRSVFRLTFHGWNVNENSYDVTHDISIWGGQNFYKSSVNISGLNGEEKLVTGIVNMHSDTFYTYNPADYTAMVTHSNQAFDGEMLGMALLALSADVEEMKTAPETGDGIIETYMMVLNAEMNRPTEFYFYSGWELLDPSLADLDYFVSGIEKDAQQFSNPVEVSFN